MNKYAIIIAGPSGAGKTTIADGLIETLGNLEMSRSATTRDKRGDGRDDEYIYLTKSEFLDAISNGDMLEHTEYGENYYGTRKAEFERIWGMNKNPILVLDYNGVASLKSRLDIPVFAVYVYTTLKEAESRLRKRDMISAPSEKQAAVLEKRLRANIADYKKLHEISNLFDLYVENNDVASCIASIENLIADFLGGKELMSKEEKQRITEVFNSEASTL